MATVTGAFITGSTIGIKEDLANLIANIDPYDTPLQTFAGRSKATQPLFEWQTDTLDSAVSTNYVAEGYAFSGTTVTATTRSKNYCQISIKEVVISGTNEASLKAGRESEYGYQILKAGRSLRRDMDQTLSSAQGLSSSDPRQTRGLESWLSTNESRGSSGVAATTETASPTDGTQRAFTETLLKAVILLCYTNGSNADTLLVGPFNKQAVSAFTGRTQARQNIASNKILGAASLYASDFGDITIRPNRRQRERTAFLLDKDYIDVAYLRRMHTTEMAKVGDAKRGLLLCEYGLRVTNEKAHGVIADLNAS